MNDIELHREFVNDLLAKTDGNFTRRIMKCVFDEALSASNKSDDHRYHGIPDAWIRYVSRGNTAFRIIYIKKNNGKNLFYRCGGHEIEDSLQAPKDELDTVNIALSGGSVDEMIEPLTDLSNHRKPLIYSALLGRRFVSNKSVYIVSPFIDPTLLHNGERLGKVLSDIREEGAEVTIITSLDRAEAFESLSKNLDARGIEIVFKDKLHAKIYLFISNFETDRTGRPTPSMGIIGSSNLTKQGISQVEGKGNFEYNYTVSPSSIEKLEQTVTEYYCLSHDYRRAKKFYKKRQRLS